MGSGTVTGFLDAHQWIPLAKLGVATWGGHPNAQFRRASGQPLPAETVELLLSSAESWRKIADARTLRRALADLGGSRTAIGDLLIGSSPCAVVTPAAAAVLKEAGWSTAPGWPGPAESPKKVTVSASRLDAVVAAVFRVSRGEAQTAIEYGFVFLDFQPPASRKVECRADDQIVFRGKGRAVLRAVGEQTRSGRLWLEYELFPA